MEKQSRKNLISAAITVLILLIGIFGFLSMKGMKKSTVSAKVEKKERRTVKYSTFTSAKEQNSINIDGRLQAVERVNLTSKVQGLMQEGSQNIREGRYYKKGEILFTIDSKEASFNLKASKSLLLTSITQMMPDLKFDYPEAYGIWLDYLNDFDLERNLKELPKTVSEKEKYFIAGRNIHNQYFNIKSQEARLQEYTIYAPFSGVVTMVNVFPGTLISPGQTLASMINTGTYEIQAPIPLEDLQYVKTGQTVNLKSTELGMSWKGRVNRIGTQIDANTQNLPLYISVSGKGLKDGIYLTGQLHGNILDDVIALPKDIFVTPTDIYLIEDSTIVSKTLAIVKRTENSVLVRDLSPNDKVISGSLAGLFEGQKVNY